MSETGPGPRKKPPIADVQRFSRRIRLVGPIREPFLPGMDPDQRRGCRHEGDFHFLNRFKGHVAEGGSTSRWNRSVMPTRPSEMPGAEHRVGVTNRPEQALNQREQLVAPASLRAHTGGYTLRGEAGGAFWPGTSPVVMMGPGPPGNPGVRHTIQVLPVTNARLLDFCHHDSGRRRMVGAAAGSG